jgi:hypothetical protein
MNRAGEKFPGPVLQPIGCALGAGLIGLLAFGYTSAAGCAAGHVRVAADIGGGVAFLPDALAGDGRLLRARAVDQTAATVGKPGSAGPDRGAVERRAARRAFERTGTTVIDRTAVGVETGGVQRRTIAVLEGSLAAMSA